MKEISISKFKATCLAVLEEVCKTGEPVRVTRFGKPVADVVPPRPKASTADAFGALKGTVSFPEELVEATAVPEEDWEVLRK